MSQEAAFYKEFMGLSPRSFFHVNWTDSVRPGGFIHRTKLNCRDDPAISQLAAELQLDTVSYFGEKHLWGDRSEWGTACRELICEWVRRERHSGEISRLNALFGFESVKEAERFCELNQVAAPVIWKVLAVDCSGKKDMNWFEKPGTLMEKFYHADRYWRGEPSGDSPCWEILLHPSVFVEGRVS